MNEESKEYELYWFLKEITYNTWQ